MNSLIYSLINLDTREYLKNYPDLNPFVKHLNPIDQQLWLLDHFVKHGYEEHRHYKIVDVKQTHKSKDKSHSTTVSSNPPTVKQLIHEFRQQHTDDESSNKGHRDKSPPRDKVQLWDLTNVSKGTTREKK
jgi:hypothetical protein